MLNTILSTIGLVLLASTLTDGTPAQGAGLVILAGLAFIAGGLTCTALDLVSTLWPRGRRSSSRL